MKARALAIAACALVASAATLATKPDAPQNAGEQPLSLGNFSVSLAVKDLAASRAFYERLGFTSVGGNAKNWLILKNGPAVIGLFQGMFDKNTLTFNPGWNDKSETLPDFDDVRSIQRILKERGLTLTNETDLDANGPAFITLVDPDGNPVLIDQHVPKPTKAP